MLISVLVRSISAKFSYTHYVCILSPMTNLIRHSLYSADLILWKRSRSMLSYEPFYACCKAKAGGLAGYINKRLSSANEVLGKALGQSRCALFTLSHFASYSPMSLNRAQRVYGPPGSCCYIEFTENPPPGKVQRYLRNVEMTVYM